MKKTLIIFSLLMTLITAQTIIPKTVKARDSVYRGGHHSSNTPLISTIEASSEVSIQMTSALSTKASSDATSENQHQKRKSREYSELEFLNNNRLKITEDISNGGGEHLLTLMTMMHLKKSRETLIKVQSNFETLSELEDKDFLSELREISNS